MLHSLCLGLVRVSAEATANTLLLQRYGSGAIPFTLMAAALINPLLSYAYSRLRTIWSPVNLWRLCLALLVLALVLCRMLLQGPARWPAFVLVLFFQTAYLLTALEFWGLCSRVLDLRQAKRLLGTVASGELAAQIVLGLCIPLWVSHFGTANLLWICLLGLLGCLACLQVLSKQVRGGHQQDAEELSPGRAPSGPQGNYVRILWACTACLTFCVCFVSQIFYDLASSQYPDEVGLASFLGRYQAASGFLALATGTLASRWIFARFGVSAGLLSFPCGVWLLALGLSWPGLALSLAFALAVSLKLQEDALFDSLYRPSYQTLMQPLQPAHQERVQTVSEGVVEPLMGGITGLLLLALNLGGKSSIQVESLVLAVAALLWAGLAWRVARNYREILVDSLTRRLFSKSAWDGRPRQRAGAFYRTVTQSETQSVIALSHTLDQAEPGAVLYLLEILREASPAAWINWLKKSLRHPSPDMRRQTLELIERHQLEDCLSSLQRCLEQEEHPEVRQAALQALACLTGCQNWDRLGPELEGPHRLAVCAGLLKSGDLQAILSAGELLHRLLNSPDRLDRQLAARILARVGNASLYRAVLQLLRDPDPRVRLEALEAAGALSHPKLWSQVLHCLAEPELRGAAAKALRQGGEGVLGELDVVFAGCPGEEARLRLVRIAASIQHPLAEEWLALRLHETAQRTRWAALRSLSRRGWRAAPTGPVPELMQQDLRMARQLWQWAAALPEHAPLTRRALNYQLESHKQAVLLWLSLLYPNKTLRKIADICASQQSRAAALELLEVTLPRSLGETVLPLFEAQPPAQDSSALANLTQADPARLGGWLVGCAAYELGSQEGDHSMLSRIEKVLLLKKVSFFGQIADEVLAEAADLLQEVDAPAGHSLFEAGEIGKTLYVIVHGQVKVHQGPKVLNQLGPGQLFGEMSLLDSLARTASVTCLEDCRLLQLHQESLYELMSDHPEVMQGIIHFLTARLRSNLAVSDQEINKP